MRVIPETYNRQDWPRLVKGALGDNDRAIQALTDRVAALEADNGEGLGWIDYSDTTAGTPTAIASGVWTQVVRPLAASPTNNRLQGIFTGHNFWDGVDNVVRPRGLYDVFYISCYIVLNASATGGVLDVQLLAGSVDIATKAFNMTGATGVDQSLRADFMVNSRSSFVTNGGKIMLRASVDCDLKEFSPEFYPLGYEV